MALWVVKGGRAGERERRMLEEGVMAIGWPELPDLSEADREFLDAEYRKTYPDSKDARVGSHVVQIEDFLHTARAGELVLMPLKSSPAVAVGEIAGDYAHRGDLGPGLIHTRPVKWLRSDIPREEFDRDQLAEFETFTTFSSAEGTEERVRQIVAEAPAAELRPAIPPARRPQRGREFHDIERSSREQIVTALQRRYRRQDLVELVEEVVRNQGFNTQRIEGGSGGTDILATPGPRSLGAAVTLAHVSWSEDPAGPDEYHALLERMQTFGAEHGVIMAWGGYDDAVWGELKATHAHVQLWDGPELLKAFLSVYEKLPETIRFQVPLKRIWALSGQGHSGPQGGFRRR